MLRRLRLRREALWLGAAAALRRVGDDDRAVDALMAAYHAGESGWALERFLADRAREGPLPTTVVFSELFTHGRSSRYVVRHRLDSARGAEDVVHKVSPRAREGLVMEVLRGHGAAVQGVHIPSVHRVQPGRDATHIFMSYLPAPERQALPADRGELHRLGARVASIGELVADDAASRILGACYYSPELFRSAAARLAAAATPGDVDAARAAAAALDGHAQLLSARAGRLPVVFAHNDLTRSNLSWRIDEGGNLEISVVDWALAKGNLAGADLHWVLRNTDLDAAERGAAVAGYTQRLRRQLPDVADDDANFGALTYGSLRMISSCALDADRPTYLRSVARHVTRLLEVASS